VFVSLIVIDPDTIHAQWTHLYDEIAHLSQQLQRAQTALPATGKRPGNAALRRRKRPRRPRPRFL
jgi:hypothetical protein